MAIYRILPRLIQLTDDTRKTLGMSDQDAFDIEKNVDAGSRWLKQKIDAHGGDLRHGLTAYNGSGPKARQYAEMSWLLMADRNRKMLMSMAEENAGEAQ